MKTFDMVVYNLVTIKEESIVTAFGFNYTNVGHLLCLFVDSLTNLIHCATPHLSALLERLHDDDWKPHTFKERTFDVELLDGVKGQGDGKDELILCLDHHLSLVKHLVFAFNAILDLTDDFFLLVIRFLKVVNEDILGVY